jgi:hypothetical protein
MYRLVSASKHTFRGSSLAIGIGGITVRLHTSDAVLAERYAGFLGVENSSDFDF